MRCALPWKPFLYPRRLRPPPPAVCLTGRLRSAVFCRLSDSPSGKLSLLLPDFLYRLAVSCRPAPRFPEAVSYLTRFPRLPVVCCPMDFLYSGSRSYLLCSLHSSHRSFHALHHLHFLLTSYLFSLVICMYANMHFY